jgi:proline-specific peptidase
MRAFAPLALAGCMSTPMAETPSPSADRYGHFEAGAGVRIGYREVGRGPQTIVVLQGGPGFTMDYIADDLLPLARRHTLIFHDPRGIGRSTLVSDAASLDAQRMVDDVEALRRHFGLPKLTLLGHSWGAGVAALYAQRFPQHVERMIIVGGIPLHRAELARTLAAIRAGGDDAWRSRLRERGAAVLADPGDVAACRAFYETWYQPFFVDPAALRRSKGDFCAGGPDSLRNKVAGVDRFVIASLGDFDWRPALKQVHAPTLLIHGAADPIPSASATEWAATLPDARLLLMPDVGHFPYLEAPEAFFDAVERFVAGEWPREARKP